MFKLFEKYWPLISILLFIVLLACLLFWPSTGPSLGLAILILSVLVGIVFTVRKHVGAYQKGQLDQVSTMRNIFVDEFGVLMSIVASILIAGRVAQIVGLAAGNATERQWVGSGMVVGILSGLAVAILVGIVVGWLVQSTWGRLVKHPRALTADSAI